MELADGERLFVGSYSDTVVCKTNLPMECVRNPKLAYRHVIPIFDSSVYKFSRRLLHA